VLLGYNPLMRLLVLVLTLSLGLVSCAKNDTTPATGPHATITLRDGSSYTGRVTASTAAQITLVGDDNQVRVINTPNVKSIEYWEAPTTPVQAQAQAEQPHPEHYHPDQSAIKTTTYVVPAGARISVRTEETIDSRRAAEGQTFAAEVTRDVLDSDGAVVIPRGANAQIIIRSASQGGHFKGRSDLVMDLASVSIGGQQYQLETNSVARMGKQGVGANRRTAKFVGSGAAIGAIIGAIAGGGKGAAIGAASGAGAGAGGEILTKGPAVRVPVESVLTFRLEAPLRVASADAGQ
jgi:hypothetical protein